MRSAVLATALAGLAVAVAGIPTISTKGSKFFTSEGDQFFVKGIAYQLLPSDPLLDKTQCGLDSALMKEIGTNSIRVYHVDPAEDHDDCMKTFADAGIYIWLDLDTFDTQIEQMAPRWNGSQFERFAAVMDTFHKYDNLAGFFVGNEVLTTGDGSVAAPYVKAAARDMKAHRDAKQYRNIPIGYSAADIATLRPMLQNYMACGSNASEALDFYSLNAYSWCGNSNFKQSGYAELIKNVTDVNYNIPIFLSETGCIVPKPRGFEDQEAIFGSDMTDNWSGAIIYEWIMEDNQYGLINYGPMVDQGYPRSGTPTPVLPDFPNLSNRWKTLSPTGVKASEYNPTLTPPPCPAFTSVVWEVDAASGLPTLGQVYNAQEASKTESPAPSDTSDGQTPQNSTKEAAAPTASAGGLSRMALGLMGVLAGFIIWM